LLFWLFVDVSTVSRLAFLARRSSQIPANTTIARNKTPPTTPPAIAPTLLEDLADEGVLVLVLVLLLPSDPVAERVVLAPKKFMNQLIIIVNLKLQVDTGDLWCT
jgi:hypothetical protein